MTETELLTKVIDLLKENSKLSERYKETINVLKKELAQARMDQYRVGVIGVTSSGKSTMINAILGDDLLCMAVKPSSSQLVTCSKSKVKKATVYFENRPQIEYIGKDLTPQIIQKYSDENYNRKNKEQVKQVKLSTPNFALPDDILLVDSPGLDAYGLEGHERLTMTNLLPTIHFCIFVTTFKTNSDEKMKSVLNTIAEYKCPVIIVQNMLDSVKPSPDGKKSSIDVANEHKTRVERIIDRSNITDKSSVRIVQISSKLALEGRLEKDPEKLRRSNYQKLVDSVTDTLDIIKPNIESNRISLLKERIKKLITEAQQDISPDTGCNEAKRFEFEGLDTRIEAELDKVSGQIGQPIRELVEYLCRLNAGDNSNFENKIYTFTESEMQRLKTKVSDTEGILVSQMKAFNEKISEYCRRLSVEERRLRIVESFGEVPELSIRTHTVPRLREKSGVFSGVARFFGGIFNTNWGYERYNSNEYDEAATRAAAIEYLKRVIALYSRTCDQWLKSSESVKKELIKRIRSLKAAFEARKVEIADKRAFQIALQRVISGLQAIVRSIPEIKYDPNEKVKHSETDMELELVKMKVPADVMTIYKYAEKYRLKFHEQVIKGYGISEQDTDVIISWDSFCTTVLMKNWFGAVFSEDVFESGIQSYKNIYIVTDPSAERLRALLSRINASKINWIVLFTATQYGSALKSLSDLDLGRYIRNNDELFFVCQDFEELINGNGVKDGLKNMMNICSELGIQKKAMIALNDNNPIYSIAALQSQRVPCITQADEISLLDLIKQRFRFMLDRNAEKTVVEIIQALQ